MEERHYMLTFIIIIIIIRRTKKETEPERSINKTCSSFL